MEFQTLGVQALVVAMMVALGLELGPADIVEGLRHRRAVAALVVVNVVVIPVVAWVLIGLGGFSSGLRVGLLLTAVSPGGPTGPLFTRMARGDVGFGVGVMVLLGAVGLVSAPLSMTLLLDRSGGDALLWPMLQTLLLFQVAPLCAAMAVRRVVPKLAATVSRPATLIANGLLLAVIVGLLATRGHLLFSSGLALHAFAVGFVLVSAGAATLGADATGRVRAGGMVTAVRNLSVALLLSARYFSDPQTDVAILSWGFWMMVMPATFALVRARRSSEKTAKMDDG